MDDAELVRQVLQGNLGAYVDLVKRYTAQIAALCRAHIHRPGVVEDLVQETFLRGLDRLASLASRQLRPAGSTPSPATCAGTGSTTPITSTSRWTPPRRCRRPPRPPTRTTGRTASRT